MVTFAEFLGYQMGKHLASYKLLSTNRPEVWRLKAKLEIFAVLNPPIHYMFDDPSHPLAKGKTWPNQQEMLKPSQSLSKISIPLEGFIDLKKSYINNIPWWYLSLEKLLIHHLKDLLILDPRTSPFGWPEKKLPHRLHVGQHDVTSSNRRSSVRNCIISSFPTVFLKTPRRCGSVGGAVKFYLERE